MIIIKNDKAYYTIESVARILKKSQSKVRDLLKQNILISEKIGGRLYIEVDLVNQYMKHLIEIVKLKNQYIKKINKENSNE